MKRLNLVLTLAVLAFATIFSSCNKDIDPIDPNQGILPERFKVDIPSSISSSFTAKSANDTLQGNDIYNHLTSFIWVGEHAADIIGEIINVVSANNLSQPMSFSFVSDDDYRTKQVVIVETSEFDGTIWEYQMTISDDGQGNTSTENKALQLFWNTTPIKGIALMNPYNLNRTTDTSYIETMYRIEYSEAVELGYERHMLVAIEGLPLEDPLTSPYSMKTLKMFVGKNGDAVSVFGNSDHPNAVFFNGDVGFDWAFTAAALQTSDIGVAEVGLPRNFLNSTDRYTLLVENSIENVFSQQIFDVWPNIDSTIVQYYLHNTEAPGFFAQNGFVQGGVAPSSEYSSLLNIIAGITPYSPLEVSELELLFKP